MKEWLVDLIIIPGTGIIPTRFIRMNIRGIIFFFFFFSLTKPTKTLSFFFFSSRLKVQTRSTTVIQDIHTYRNSPIEHFHTHVLHIKKRFWNLKMSMLILGLIASTQHYRRNIAATQHYRRNKVNVLETKTCFVFKKRGGFFF